jgi:putative transcriptional regulator
MFADPPFESYEGRLLIALSDMPDPRFARSVILLCAHSPAGAMGLTLSDPLETVGLHGVLSELDIATASAPDSRVLRGGPVEPGRGAVLHGLDWSSEETVGLTDSLALTASIEILQAIGRGEGPQRYELFLGYAGWAGGQIESELAAPGWLLGSSDPAPLLDLAPERRWSAALLAEGVDPAMLAIVSGHA